MKKIILFIGISMLILSIRVVIQPQYDHYVIGNHFNNTCIVFSWDGVDCIWIGDRMYTPGTIEEYSNL